MRLDDYPEKDGKRVWLEQDELAQLVQESQKPEERVAFMLGGRAGLRAGEIASVTWPDFIKSHGGYRIRIWEDYAKRDKYREVPIGQEVYSTVQTLSYNRDADDPIVGCHKSTIWDWVRRAAERRIAATGDRGWDYLKPHDLRRTWTYLVGQGVIPGLVMQWGGWEDWETFRDNYLGEMSPEVDKREQQKVPWLSDGAVDLSDPSVHSLPAGTKNYATTD